MTRHWRCCENGAAQHSMSSHNARSHRAQGMTTSANLREGATYWSNAGFTNLVYCSITPPTSRPRTVTSRWMLQAGKCGAMARSVQRPMAAAAAAAAVGAVARATLRSNGGSGSSDDNSSSTGSSPSRQPHVIICVHIHLGRVAFKRGSAEQAARHGRAAVSVLQQAALSVHVATISELTNYIYTFIFISCLTSPM